jgi:hypothetical protein
MSSQLASGTPLTLTYLLKVGKDSLPVPGRPFATELCPNVVVLCRCPHEGHAINGGAPTNTVSDKGRDDTIAKVGLRNRWKAVAT